MYHLFMYSMDYNILVFLIKDHQTMIKIKTKTQKKNAWLKLVWAKFGLGDEILGWVFIGEHKHKSGPKDLVSSAQRKCCSEILSSGKVGNPFVSLANLSPAIFTWFFIGSFKG